MNNIYKIDYPIFNDYKPLDYFGFSIKKAIKKAWIAIHYESIFGQYTYLYNQGGLNYSEWITSSYHSKLFIFSGYYELQPNLSVSANYSILNNDKKEVDWAINNFFDVNLSYRTVFGININSSFNYDSGKAYTPTTETGNLLEAYSKNMKPNHFLNLKISKNFRLDKNQDVKVYVLVKNVYDRKNEIYVYPITGSPYYDGVDISDQSGYTADEVQYIHDLYTKNPENVSAGRTIIIGMEYSW